MNWVACLKCLSTMAMTLLIFACRTSSQRHSGFWAINGAKFLVVLSRMSRGVGYQRVVDGQHFLFTTTKRLAAVVQTMLFLRFRRLA